jgi:SNF2 family DNA or RNA helicase
MLIHTATRKVVLNLREPARVTTVIPTAKTFPYKGSELVAVPHRDDETRVLRNLGFEVPAPVELYYKWPGQYKPFKAQLSTTSFLTTNPHAFVLSDMGTGKTLSALWAFDYLRSIGKARKMLVISPLSTLERTWADEIFANFSSLTVGVLHGTKDRRRKILADDYDVYLVNHDGIKVIQEELIAKTDIDTVIIDEIAAFRNASTARWKSLKKIIGGRERVWGMTGTPTPNAPTDAWAQCRLVSPDRVPRYFGAFRDSVMKQLGPFKWLPREGSSKLVAEAMQPAVRFTRDECVDLPPCIYQTREVQMTPEQAKAYKQMTTQLKMELDERQVTAVNEAVKMQKLVQIACGVVYGADREEVVLPNDPRVDVVKEVIEEAGTKVIVFVPFKAVLNRVAAQLAEEFPVAKISGETPKHERDDIFHHFQKSAEPRVLVAQPAAMSHGLTLTAASTVIWYAPVTSHEIYLQANARITRPGQKQHQLIVNIEATEVERRIYKRLKTKSSMQGLLLDLVKSE